ncbi:MAG TPA: FAD-binding oxidoreductase [Streptosporangiaceae bacterium]|nr:FAD-binding oxidoreductase [Streptosporangiaceae bacterium]
MPMAADSIPASLAAACAEVRAATPADKIGGVQPAVVAAPASTGEASAVLKAATALGLAVVPRGTGTKLDWGSPPERADLVIDTRQLNRVIEHAAGDLVASVEAGVALDELAEVLARAGQRLALDPPGGGPGTVPGRAVGLPPPAAPPNSSPARTGTVGGLLATNVAGPLRLRYGTPRDLLIGITVVRADGTVAKSGGKVVKNVAGYDLGKLFAGSRGTLGLITQATFRLHPIPPATAYLLAECAPPDCRQLLDVALRAEIAPVAAELDWRPAAGAPARLAVALEGDAAGVAERAALLAGLVPGATAAGEPPPWWGAAPVPYRDTGRGAVPAGTLLQLAFWVRDLTDVLAALAAAARQAGLDPAVNGSAAAGVLGVALPADAEPDQAATFITRLRADLLRAGQAGDPGHSQARASVVVRRAPAPVAERVDLFGPVPALAVMRAVKQQFDPDRMMSPGRFAGGL